MEFFNFKIAQMKTLTFIYLFLLMIAGTDLSAQETTPAEKFGKTLNAGIGVGYYGYVGYSIPVLHADYEFDVAKNFTLAPFITYYSYQRNYYWKNSNYPEKYYYYRVTTIPVGIKGSYYFDELLHAGSRWDFYLGASLGFAIRKTTWENGYYGETSVQHGSSGLYLDGHIGTEYHLNQKLGLFLDLSSGISTLGLAVHF